MTFSVLSLTLEKAKVHNLWGWKEVVQRDILMGCDPNQTKSKLWQVVSEIPAECDTEEMKVEMTKEEKVGVSLPGRHIHAFYFISNTFISNARLKFVNFQNLSRKILRTEL